MTYPFSNVSKVRVFPVWVTIIIMIGIWLATQIASLMALGLVLFLAGSNSANKAISHALPSSAIMSSTILLAILLASLTMIVLVVLWSRNQEQRSLADLGIRLDRVGWRQYRIGLLTGLLFALALIALATGLQMVFSSAITSHKLNEFSADWTRLAQPGLWALILVLALVFAVQGAAEELLCRGWLLGALAAKRGLLFGLILSSFLFASLHVHYFFIDGLNISAQQILIGTVAIGAIFAMGLMFAMISFRDRSIMGAAGWHSVFNFLVVVFAMIYFTLFGDSNMFLEAFVKAFDQGTKVQKIEPALVVQLLLSILVAGFLFWKFGLPKPAIPKPASKD